ncbi:MAG TPA: aldehyde dehydrogenase family protein, partial [Holophagaceae bacterium]|nr:aldehyde dehydrogenase family protein [Holophagaceae bacterium]
MTTTLTPTWTKEAIFEALGLKDMNSGVSDGTFFANPGGHDLVSENPSNGERLATVKQGDDADYEAMMGTAMHAFQTWRMMPAPQRGEIVRQLGEAFRKHKEPLGALISLEMGKIYS